MPIITPILQRSRYRVTAVFIFLFLFTLASNTPFAAAQDTTVIVSPDNLNGWTLRRENPNLRPGTGQFTFGPAPAPLGYGSVRLTINDGSVGESITRPMPTTRFSNITTLTYHTYRAAGGSALAVALQFQVCRSYFGPFCSGSSRLIYEPYWAGSNPATGVWQEWDALAPQAKWWMTGISRTATCGMDNPCTVATLLATYPNLDIRSVNNIGLLLKAGAGSGWTSFDGYVDNLTIGVNGVDTTYNFEPYLPVHNITQDVKYPTIQQGVDGANPGDVLVIDPGAYAESVIIDKRLSLIGAGSGTDGTIITASGGPFGVVQLDASGLSTAEPLLLKDLRIQPNGRSGISVGQLNGSAGKNISYVELDNVQVIGTNANACTEQERGLYVDLTSSLNHLTVKNSAFNNLHHGWYLQKQLSADASTVQYVTVQDTTFNHNNFKGIYAEKLSNATFSSITASENGYVGALPGSSACEYFRPWMSGVDINLKAGSYQNITFSNSTFSNNGLDGAVNGVGLAVKARDDAPSYTAFPASLSGVLVDGGAFSGNKAGIRFGEPGKDNAGPVNGRIQNAAFSTNVDYSLNNQSRAVVTAAGNQFNNEATVFVKSAAGGLLAYANNILSFNDAGLNSMTGVFNGRHNWWGAHTSQPTGVNDDSGAYRLGAPVVSWVDGNSAVSLADAIAGDSAAFSGAGTLVIVNHGSSLANVPFGKGIEADTGANQCADFYDFFAIDGSGSYNVSIPVNSACTDTLIGSNLFQFALDGVGAPDLTCAPDTACWQHITATRAGNVLTAVVPAADVLGTPFAAPSFNNNDPTAVSLSSFSPANHDGWGITVMLMILLFTITGAILIRRRQS